MQPANDELTQLLRQWSDGDRSAFDRLVPMVYSELRKIAQYHMRSQDADHTLQTTAIVHEAYLKLLGSGKQDWESRSHFFAVASKAMRQVIVSYARERQTLKRGGEVSILPLEEELQFLPERTGT